MGIKDVAVALLVMAIWGFNFAVAKTGVGELPGLLLTALRFALVAALLAPFFRPKKSQIPGLALLALTMGTLHFGLLFMGLQWIDAAASAIIVQLQAPFSALLAFIFFRERLGWARAGGMALAFSGVVLLAGGPSRVEPLGLLLTLISGLGFALSTVVVKRLGAMHPLTITGWMSLLGCPQLLAASLLFEEGQWDAILQATWRGWGAVVYTAVFASIVAHTLWYRLLRQHPMNVVVPFSLLAPAIGVASGVLLLGEPFGWHKAAGGLLTLTGVAMIQLISNRSRSA
jgi:O-acetylserine/cysteine efflux transporter